MPPKLLACIGFLYKVVHKIGRLQVQLLCGIEFKFLSLGISSRNLAHLFIMYMVKKKKDASDCLIFAQGFSYGLSKLKKKNGVKLSLNFEIS